MLGPGSPWRRAIAAAALVMAAAGVGGCAQAGASTSVQVATAFVPVPATPGTTVAYVVIRNNGSADRLVSARTSAGGRVRFRAPGGGHGLVMHDVPAISIPAHSTFQMKPDGDHMLITGLGPVRGGKDITITLVFAHAGAISVVAQVTDPETGGSSYFLN